MTIILTLVGVVVFFISLFTVGFRAAFKRLMTFTVTGLVIDIVLYTLAMIVLYITSH